MNTYENEMTVLSPFRQAAGGTVVVTLVFGVVIAVLLAVNLYHYAVTDPARALVLEDLKTRYTQQPTETRLGQEIYDLDIEIRRNQFARLYFLQHGTVLLVIDLAVLITAVLIRTRHLRTFALPEADTDRKKEQIRHALHVRTAVTLTTIALGAVGLYVSQRPFTGHSDVKEGQEAQGNPAVQGFATFEEAMRQWPSFRGADGSGVTALADIPDDWDGSSGRNILWKTEISLPGHNSPVIWGEQVFLSGATEEQQQVYCFDLNTGTMLWANDVTIADDPARADMYIMDDTGCAAPTVVTDGIRVAAIYAGGDIGCFSINGTKLWERHLGVPQSAYGYAASLAAFEKTIIVQYDVTYETESSRLIALDWQTGQIVWQTPRPVPNSWTSPTVVKVGDVSQLLTSGSPWVIAYDPRTGKELYRADCLSGDVAPTQIYANGKIIAIDPYNAITAVNVENASGDVTGTHLAWRSPADIPDICSPVSNGALVWTLTTNGTLIAFDTTDGSEVYSHSLDAAVQASPSLVGQTLYILTERGTMILAGTGREFTENKRLELGEKCFASPAFAPGRIVIRGQKNLYCIGAKP